MGVRVAHLRALFTYDADTGRFFRLRSRGVVLWPPVEVTGPMVVVHGRSYRTDRIIWHYVFGRWPVGKIVHLNGDDADNRMDNMAEQPPASPIPGKLLGAHFNRRTQRWYAMISRNGRNKSLGTYDTAEEAHRVYMLARDGAFP